MILIVGNNKDDILYFETRINDKREEKIFNKYRVVIGNISSQPVMLLSEIYTNVMSAALLSYVIEKYFVLFVIKIGKCLTLSKTLDVGNIVISRKVYACDVDVSDIQGVKIGQLPNFPTSYTINNDLLNLVTSSISKVAKQQAYLTTYISSNKHFTDINDLKPFIHDDLIFGQSIDETVFDSELYGIAMVCYLFGIPFISINVVYGHVGDEFSSNNYIKLLKQYGNLGNSVANIIGEVGSKEVLRN